ncbi:MAG TPA: serine hydrolase [Steroidobacteraceae bacterium]|nr:serine hydrolase [Steroidobacteraceae bacterium]
MGLRFLPKSATVHGTRPRLPSLVWSCVFLTASAACAAAPIHLASISRYHHHHHVHHRHRGSAAQPNLRSSEALVLDVTDHKVLYARKADGQRPIASITKLMTTLVVSEARQPLDQVLQVTDADRSREPSRLAVGTRLTRAQLFHLALMASENRAAHALARNYPGGLAACVSAMNAKARALGMTHTHFLEPTGLSSEDASTPADLAKLVMAASQSPVIRLYSTSPGYTIRSGRRMVAYHNTDLLVKRASWHILVQKTGFTNPAGHCLVMQAVIDHRTVVIVLLNSWGRYTRVADARRVRQWAEAQLNRHAVRQVASRA